MNTQTNTSASALTTPASYRTGWRAKILAKTTASDEVEMRDMLHADKLELLGDLRGTVLEIGPGTGPNMPYYAPDTHVIGVEPNAYVHEELQRKVDAFAGSFILKVGSAESLDLPDASVDAVVSTMVLCSVPSPKRALAEILRVLKPGGRFVFIEHVVAEDQLALKALQYAATPFWHTCGDGCCPVRRTWLDIEAAGFARVAYRRERYGFKIPVASTCIVGSATK